MSVRLELGEVSELWLARPDKYNALDLGLADAFAEAIAAVRAHSATRLLVLRGEGRAFCSGGDFGMLKANASALPEQNQRAMDAFYRRFLGLLSLPCPTLAVIHGAAVGAGLSIALACDLRIAASEAKLGVNFVRVGLHPGMGTSVLLPHWVGHTQAASLLLTGRLIRGDEAAAMGLVTRSVPKAELETAVQATITELLATAPIASRQLTQTLRAPLLAQLDAALAREAACQAVDFATEDLQEAVRAFSDSREPVFRGA